MASPNVFKRVYSEETEGAVTVRIFKVDGQVVGEPSFPTFTEGGAIIGPALGAPMPVLQAFNRAIDMQREFGLRTIVVQMDEPGLWDPEWGILQDE